MFRCFDRRQRTPKFRCFLRALPSRMAVCIYLYLLAAISFLITALLQSVAVTLAAGQWQQIHFHRRLCDD